MEKLCGGRGPYPHNRMTPPLKTEIAPNHPSCWTGQIVRGESVADTLRIAIRNLLTECLKYRIAASLTPRFNGKIDGTQDYIG